MNNFERNRYMRNRPSNSLNQNRWAHGNLMQRNNFNSSRPFNLLPGSEKYWCETCDKGFLTKILLNYHIQRHQKCNIDGCQFIAHPQIITRHIQMQHATGLYKRIGKLNNPEEIKKWREERKRKYPTKENIEKKKAEIKEKISRGEKMGLNRELHGMKRTGGISNKSGLHNKGKKSQATRHYVRTLNNKRIIRQQLPVNKKPATKIFTIQLPKQETRKLQPFKGIQDLVIGESVDDEIPETCNLIQDDEDISDKEQKVTINMKPALCGALTSLICNYGSSDEEDIEEFSKNVTNKATATNSNIGTITFTKLQNNVNNEQPIDKICNIILNMESKNDSSPEEIKTNKEGPIISSNFKPDIKTRKERLQKLQIAKRKSKIINLKRKLPSTLLQKLLHSEIQQERNTILQCIRYVVQNDYFDK